MLHLADVKIVMADWMIFLSISTIVKKTYVIGRGITIT